MSDASALERGREAYRRQAWTEAHAGFSAADQASPLGPEDLGQLAITLNLLGRDGESGDCWARAHREFLGRGDITGAARAAFWLTVQLLFAGDLSQASGWIARGRRLLDGGGHEGVERGYLRQAEALRSIFFEGDVAGAATAFAEAGEIGQRFGDRELTTLARQGQGRALIRLGEVGRGMTLLDEAMAAIGAGEVTPVVIGAIYCSVIEACHETFDLRRAQEWTSALSQWCERQSDLVPYRGQCLLHRAELLQLHGAWSGAAAEAEQARSRLSHPPPHRAIGAAFYQIGELHRLRGEFVEAEAAFREASRADRDPQPGLARLRLAEGKTAAASSTISRALAEAGSARRRAEVLPACVEIALESGDVVAARAAADELSQLSDSLEAPQLQALSAHATGAVLLAEGNAAAALAALRIAASIWRELAAPYDAAQARVLIGLCCGALGDADSAELELDAARQLFQQLGAVPDAQRVGRLLRPVQPQAAGGLTSRELQVLALVVAGRSNRAIATALRISEKTVARHLSNIFGKLGVSSRGAATAYAHDHGLIAGRT